MTPYELQQDGAARARNPALTYSLLAAAAVSGCAVGWMLMSPRQPPALSVSAPFLSSVSSPVSEPSVSEEKPAAPAAAEAAPTPPPPAALAATNEPAQPAVVTPPPAPQSPVASPPPPPAEKPAEPAAAPAAASAPSSSALADIKRLKNEDNFTEARVRALELLKNSPSAEDRKAAEDLLSEMAIPLVFSKRPMAEKIDYTVVSGDSLDKLARKFGTTVETIRRGNNLPGQVIRLGTRLRILQGQFSLVVDKSDNTLLLKLNDTFFKRYRVGTGQYATTPTGSFKITGKVAQPTWYRPDGKSIPYGDKENLLGTHWMSIDVPGFGIHGTWEPDSVGKQSSQGCIRLVNADVEELFNIVPEGTPVLIQD